MDALDVCRRILKESGSNFALAFRVLPARQQDAMTAFYAFCRVVDDAVDGARNAEEARLEIDSWRKEVRSVFEGGATRPVARALEWTAARFPLTRAHLDWILDGVEQDLHRNRFRTFEELYAYCYPVASAVGLAVVAILAPDHKDTGTYAELSGIAVQLTNILRDVGEDARRGRIYLPLEDLERFGVAERDLLDGRNTPTLRNLLRFQGARTEHFYQLAEAALPPDLEHRLYFAETLRLTYYRLFQRIRAVDYDVLHRSVRLGKREKLAVAVRKRLHPKTFLESFR